MADNSVRLRESQIDIWVNFGSHQPLVTLSEPDQNDLPGAQFGQSEPPQGFHVDENVFCAVTACQEAEAFGAIEPFDDRPFQTAAGCHLNVGANRRQLRRMHRR